MVLMATTLTDAPYSKKRLNRAGRVLRDVRRGGARRSHEVLAAIEAVDWWRGLHAKPLARVNAGLRYYVRKVGVSHPDVTQRLKRFSTVVHKLDREPTMQLTTMEDIAGVRAVLPAQDLVDALVAELQRQPRWKIRRLREYVEGRDPGPKSDGYRAVHVVVEKDACYVEIQLRTPWQDAWAQSVEQDTRRLRSGLKFGSGPDDLREYYQMVSEFFAMRERLEEPDEEFMRALANLYAHTRAYFPESNGD
jgi:putative GTP pyrophosphokinase